MKRNIVILLSLLSICTFASSSLAATKVVLLGTGSPVPDPDRSGPSLAIVVNDTSYIIDCGVNCVRQATKAYQEKGIQALSDPYLKKVFFTHLHSDHTLGYPDLILTPWDRRITPLEVYGPPGTRAMTNNILKAYKLDIKVRETGLQKLSPKTLKPNVHEIKPGLVYKDENITVTAFPVKHGTFPHSFGYKFVTPDKTIVISGDTSPDEIIVDEARGADMLIHEVYAMAKYRKQNPQTQAYLRSFHTSTTELARIANEARPKVLVPIHMLGYKGLPTGTIMKEIREAGYKGTIKHSHDLAVY